MYISEKFHCHKAFFYRIRLGIPEFFPKNADSASASCIARIQPLVYTNRSHKCFIYGKQKLSDRHCKTMKILLRISFASLIVFGGYTAGGNADESDYVEFTEFLDAVERGDLKAIESHLKKYPADINSENLTPGPSPYNALMAANRNIEVVKLLLEYGADASQPFGGGAGYSSSLLDAMYSADPEPKDGFDSEADASREPDSNFEYFKLLFHSIDSNGCVDTYPALAASLVNSEFDKKYAIYMLENNACISDTYTGGWSTFNGALHRDVELAKLMIPKMSLNSSDGNGYFPMHHAVRYGDKSIVAMLLDHDVYLSPVDYNCNTPLDYADHRAKTFECLIENDGCPEEWNRKTDEEGFISAQDIIRCNCSEVERREIDQSEEIVWMLEDRGAVYGPPCSGE